MAELEKTPLQKLLSGEPTGIEEPEGGLMAFTPDEEPLPWDEEDQWLANGEFAAAQRLSARVRELEAQALSWVASSERIPTESGTYVVMSRAASPHLLKLEGAVDKHWGWVTHWYGPLPVCTPSSEAPQS